MFVLTENKKDLQMLAQQSILGTVYSAHWAKLRDHVVITSFHNYGCKYTKMLLWVDMMYGRTLFRTLIVHKQAYSGKISITFEPLVRFEKFKVLNRSELNFLLIYVSFKFNIWFTRHFAAKMNIVATKSMEKSFL